MQDIKMKMSKNIVLLSITIVTLITLVAIATYSYFTASTNLNNKITTNVKMPLRPIFTVSGGGEMSLTIDRNLTLKENAYNVVGGWVSGKSYYEIAKGFTVTLTGEPGTACAYNVYYKDTSSNSTIILEDDFAIQVNKNGPEIFQVDYTEFKQTSAGISKITPLFGGSTVPLNKVKPIITIASGSTTATDTWAFLLKFYNRNWDQSYLADKSFKGELYIDDVSCT